MKNTARLRFWLLLGLIVVALASSTWGVLRSGDWEGFALNLGTEMGGAVITYALFEIVIRRAEEREEKKAGDEARKRELIEQMGSRVKDRAVAAAQELALLGVLYDGSLQGENLHEANLEGVDLERANLQGVYLLGANLAGAKLFRANLQRANLSKVNLQGANLEEADLEGANLRGTNLEQAELYNANLQEVATDRTTVLPDGSKKKSDAEWARFTDSRRPSSGHKKPVWIARYS